MPTPPIASDDELLPETRRALTHRLAVGQSEGRTPSVTAAVVRGGRLAWCGTRDMSGEHEPAADVQYRIGSISKTIVAIMVMRLRDEGLLDLADPLVKHLDASEDADVLGVGQVRDLTVAQLLSHTSGLAAEASPPWWERTPADLRPQLADIFTDRPHVHPAGRVFHYSNPGFALLGALITRLRGQDWGDVVRREVLEPLGMTRTTLLPQPPHERGWAVHPWADLMQPEPAEDTGRMAPAGQYWSTAEDMGRLAAFLLDGNGQVLSAATLAEMRVAAGPPSDESWLIGYGLGIQVFNRDDRRLYGHSGSMPGFVSAVWVSEQDGLGGVALANATSGSDPVSIVFDLIRIVAEREPAMPRPWRPLAEVDRSLLDLTGLWYWGPRPFVLRLLPDRTIDLSPSGGRGRNSRYRPEPDGTWTGLDGYYLGERLRLVRGADGAVDHIDVGSFVFTREPYAPGSTQAAQPDPDGWQTA